jgi:probable rRNA maturation factor
MKINIVEKIKAPIEKEVVEKMILGASEKLDLTFKGEVEILFVDKTEIAELNKKFRSIDRPTDVLSFPQQQVPGSENILGSIVICPAVVAEKDEIISDVLKHGLLHLVGFDHENNEEDWDESAKKIDCNL